jgi:hypothetical protein
VDGAWWPRSRDLSDELSVLADVLDPLRGRITRVAVNPRNWPILPPRIFVNGHVVKVGWFASERLDPDQILVLSASAGRWDLLVVPPETDASVAGRLMAAASTDTGRAELSASALMASEGASGESPGAGGPETGPDDDWSLASQVAVAVALPVPGDVPGHVPGSPYGRNQHPTMGM